MRPLLLLLLAGCSFRTNGATGVPDACSAISPGSCDDGIPCTEDSVDGAGCAATCVHTPITTAADGDGCCPAGASSDVDNDCSITCGNGTVESNETCDTAIASGDGACPTSCDDSMACTSDTLVSAGTCNAACSNSAITQAMSGDGCCPSGATYATDTDCPPPPTAFRITQLEMRDPHVYLSGIGGSCNDSISVANNAIQRPIDHDDNNDGYFDDSQLIVLRPLAQDDAAMTPASLYFSATCTSSSTTCQPGTLAPASITATSAATGTCLATIPGTTKPYNPAVTAATGPCFSTTAADVTASIFGAQIPLHQVQVGATYMGTTSLINGVLRGFLTEADADNTNIAFFGPITAPLSSFLPGGDHNCASFSDKDTLNSTPGWWIYLNFTAESVPWTEP